MNNIINEVKNSNAEGRLIPFIGSGFSKPLGLPDWAGLVASVAIKVGFEPDLFSLHGSYPQLLEYIKTYHHSEWKEFIHQLTLEFDSTEVNEKRKISPTHRALAELTLKTIYTTNYDTHIEKSLLDNNKKIVALANLSDFIKPINNKIDCEVIKFHGTIIDDESMVLTETQYFDRMALEEAVDQRLRSDLLSNNFLFIGYSFSDPNIRYIWYKIHKLKSIQKTYRQDLALRKSFYVTYGNEPIQSKLLEQWNIKIVTLDPVDRNGSLCEFLKSIQ